MGLTGSMVDLVCCCAGSHPWKCIRLPVRWFPNMVCTSIVVATSSYGDMTDDDDDRSVGAVRTCLIVLRKPPLEVFASIGLSIGPC